MVFPAGFRHAADVGLRVGMELGKAREVGDIEDHGCRTVHLLKVEWKRDACRWFSVHEVMSPEIIVISGTFPCYIRRSSFRMFAEYKLGVSSMYVVGYNVSCILSLVHKHTTFQINYVIY